MKELQDKIQRTTKTCKNYPCVCYCVLVFCMGFMCFLQSKISGGDPRALIIEFRVKMSGHNSPRTNQRVFEEDPCFCKVGCQGSMPKAFFEAHGVLHPPNIKCKNFALQWGIFKNYSTSDKILEPWFWGAPTTRNQVKLDLIKRSN